VQDLLEEGDGGGAGVAGGAVDGDHALGGQVADQDPGDTEGEVDAGGQLGHREGLAAGQGDRAVLEAEPGGRVGTQVVLEVKFGRADAALADFPVAAYNAKVSGQGADFQVAGAQIDPGPYGIGVRKDDAELRQVLQEALRAIVADGSYDRVLTKWNVTDGSLKTAKVIGAPS
jgi:polar amino acid transport system substrate-binding protein